MVYIYIYIYVVSGKRRIIFSTGYIFIEWKRLDDVQSWMWTWTWDVDGECGVVRGWG